MIRKWMTVLLSLLLAVSLPLSALADTQHTLTVVPGELLSSEPAIVDLLDAVDLRLTTGNDSGALTVLIDQQEVVTLGLTADTTGLYASSAVLGEDVLYVTWEDGFAVLTDLMKENLKAQGIDDPAALESIEATMTEAKNSIVAAIGTDITLAPQAPTAEATAAALDQIAEMFPGDLEMVEYVKGIYDKMIIEDGSFTDANRDAADQKYSMTMNADDMTAICDTQYMKTTLQEALAADNPDATQEELDQMTEQVIADVRKLYETSDIAMVMNMYTLDAGETLVGLDLDMNMTLDASVIDDEEELDIAMQMTANYDRLTDAEGVSYKADAAMTVDNTKMEVLFDLYRANSGKSEGMLGLLGGGEEIVVLYQANNTAADTRVRGASVFMRSGATSILEPAASARPVIGFSVKSEPAPAETLAALENATPESSVNVLTLSEAELQNLVTTISTNGMQVAYTALGLLPTSVLNLFISSMAE